METRHRSKRPRKSERQSILERKIPLELVIPILILLLGLTVGTSLTTLSLKTEYNDSVSTLTSMAATDTVIEATRSHIIQQTATAVPPNAMHPAVKDATLVFYPNPSTACSHTITKVESVDVDHNPSTPDLTMVQALTLSMEPLFPPLPT